LAKSIQFAHNQTQKGQLFNQSAESGKVLPGGPYEIRSSGQLQMKSAQPIPSGKIKRYLAKSIAMATLPPESLAGAD